MYLGFSFEKGGNLFVELCDKTPHTLRTLSKILPLESEARHTRWCGREVYFPICTRQTPCRENQTSTVSKFDVAYWINLLEEPTGGEIIFQGGKFLDKGHNKKEYCTKLGMARPLCHHRGHHLGERPAHAQ